MSEKPAVQELVEKKFREFLEVNELRQTRERFAILRVICQQEGTFTIEELQERLNQQKFHVSTATLYNNVQLLVQANLLLRHPFSSSASVYEPILDARPRCYQVCSNCHRVTQIKSKDLHHGVMNYHPRRFNTSHRVVYIYGVCPSCASKMHKKGKTSAL